jgi:superfamily II DNA or RNA helicase
MIIGDEAHNYQAKSLSYIMNSSINTELRFGLTGSLSGAKIHEMVMKGHFGKIIQLSKNKDLIARGINAKIKINVIVLKHKEEDRKFLAKKDNKDYHTEIDFIEKCEKRNRFLVRLL